MTALRRGGMSRLGVLMVAGVLLTGCTGGGDEPAPTGSGSTTADASASPATPDWSATPVWQGTVWLRQSADLPVTMRLYPLQRIDGRILLTVDYTPQGADGAEMAASTGPFCSAPACLGMQSVSLVDPVGLVRFGPLLQGPSDSSLPSRYAASLDRFNAKRAGVTYRYGAFFADPGTQSVSVDLVSAGAIPGVSIVDGGPTAPGLVVPGPATVAASPSPLPSVETAADDSTLVTFPVATPPADAGEDAHPLIAPIVGGDITDYSGMVNLNADVLFAFNSATLSAKAKTVLAQAVRTIQDKADPAAPLLVDGHTDNIGGKAFNQRLSTQRANAVANFLKADPAAASWKLTVAGKGESEPVVPNTTPDGKDDPAARALNRRVEIAYTPKPEPRPTPSPAEGGTTGQPTVTAPTPAATVGPVQISSNGATGGTVTAEIAPVRVEGDLALVRLSITPQDEFAHADAFSRTRASSDSGRFDLIDPATKAVYLAAHDEDDEDRVLGTDGVHTMHPGRTYSYYVYTAAPPADLDTITVDLGQLGKVTVPIER